MKDLHKLETGSFGSEHHDRDPDSCRNVGRRYFKLSVYGLALVAMCELACGMYSAALIDIAWGHGNRRGDAKLWNDLPTGH